MIPSNGDGNGDEVPAAFLCHDTDDLISAAVNSFTAATLLTTKGEIP